MEEIYYSQYSNYPTEIIVNKYLNKNPNTEKGTYIEIGAGHPIHINNTYWYYTKGWNGLLVEPYKNYSSIIKEYRPRDIFEPIAITDYDGEVEMCCLTTVGSEEGDKFKIDSKSNSDLYIVKCMTINSLIKKYPQFAQPDYLSIDVESNEEKVLSKCDFTIFKPRVICIEFLVGNTDYHKPLEHYLLPYYEFKEDSCGNAYYLRKNQ